MLVSSEGVVVAVELTRAFACPWLPVRGRVLWRGAVKGALDRGRPSDRTTPTRPGQGGEVGSARRDQ